jgi:hypothetical protein
VDEPVALELPMRDASLVTCRNASCAVYPLSMTAQEFLAGAHAARAAWGARNDFGSIAE